MCIIKESDRFVITKRDIDCSFRLFFVHTVPVDVISPTYGSTATQGEAATSLSKCTDITGVNGLTKMFRGSK